MWILKQRNKSVFRLSKQGPIMFSFWYYQNNRTDKNRSINLQVNAYFYVFIFYIKKRPHNIGRSLWIFLKGFFQIVYWLNKW